MTAKSVAKVAKKATLKKAAKATKPVKKTVKKAPAKKTTKKKVAPSKAPKTKALAPTRPTIISDEEWQEKYQPIENHMDPFGSWDGTMFETYGGELEFVSSQSPNLIWTWIVDGDDSTVVSGFHTVNRMGYFVCKVPFEKVQGGIEVDIS